MYPILDLRESVANRIPSLRLDILRQHGRKHINKRQRFLSALLHRSYYRHRPHEIDHQADPFSCVYLAKGLHRPRGYQKILQDFYTFPEGNFGYSADRGLCKPYLLRADVLQALDELHKDPDAFSVVDAETGEDFVVSTLCGLPEGFSEGGMVPSIISGFLLAWESTESQLLELGERCGFDGPLDEARPGRTTIREALRILAVCKAYDRRLGGLPNFYCLQEHGRLGPQGLHVIGLPRKLRAMLFAQSGLVDYDIKSCYWAAFVSLARAIGCRCEVAQSYMVEKAQWHQHWCALTGLTNESAFKAVAVSLLTGGVLSPTRNCEAGRMLGPCGVNDLRKDNMTMALVDEVKEGMRTIVKTAFVRTEGKEHVLLNAVGATIDSNAALPRLYAHLLTGVEQFAIRTMLQVANGVVAVIYDGFIAEDQSTEVLEAAVQQRSVAVLGYEVTVELKASSFSPPSPALSNPRHHLCAVH